MEFSYLGCINHALSLLKLDIGTSGIPKVGDSKDGIGPFYRVLETRWIVEIGLFTLSSASASKMRGKVSLTATVSAPKLSNFFADGLDTSRVTPRTVQVLFVLGSPRSAFTTEPPWLPVAPKTTMTFLADIVRVVWWNCYWNLLVETDFEVNFNRLLIEMIIK